MDVVGFTSWSSVRQPTQVFALLENIYHSFDTLARRHKVFKVETVGDCVRIIERVCNLYEPQMALSHDLFYLYFSPRQYVAVTGFPEKQPDHAIRICHFANQCLRKFPQVVNKLEVSLGPDTSDLSLRIGVHSGPVVAGILRGERARFQVRRVCSLYGIDYHQISNPTVSENSSSVTL